MKKGKFDADVPEIILLCFVVIIILLGILSFNGRPSIQPAQTRNIQRWNDVQLILNAVEQYRARHDGNVPEAIRIAKKCEDEPQNEICKDNMSCQNLTDLADLRESNLTKNISFLEDPLNTSEDGTGYYIAKISDGRVVVCAPNAELDIFIRVSK